MCKVPWRKHAMINNNNDINKFDWIVDVYMSSFLTMLILLFTSGYV